eukprot:NODE_51_length_27121_cov_0.309452.p2 type:complete len:637 gc:universal NODE_51_length_27121_cov_0.309452:10393-8483(-)
MDPKIAQLQQLAEYYPNKAIKECNKYLKNQDNVMVKALLALSYTKMDNPISITLIKELEASKSKNPHVLKVLSLCLRLQGNSESVPALYEHCWKLSEELACQYFMALIRSSNYKQQRLVSSHLFKSTDKIRYVSWTGTVLYLQSQEDLQNESLLLELSKRTFDKLPDITSNPHAHYIYCETLNKLNLQKEIIKFADRSRTLDTDLQVINAYLTLGDHLKALEFIEMVLARDFTENWELLKEYAELLVKHLRTPVTFKTKSVCGKKNTLLFKMYLNHLSNKDCSKVIYEFIDFCKYQPSLLKDIKYIVSLGLAKDLFNNYQLVSVDTCTTPSNVIYYTNMCQIHFYLKSINCTSISIFNDLLKSFPLKEIKEANPVDELLLITVYSLLNENTDNSKLDALHCLLWGLKHRKFNVLFKLWAIELLAYFNNSYCIELYDSLDVKNIQVDMLSHIILDKLVMIREYKEAINHSIKCASLPLSNKIETPEMIAQAYLYESYINVIEFNDFSRRINTSLSRYCAQTEAIRGYLMLTDQSNVRNMLDRLRYQVKQVPLQLVDNRDYKVYQYEYNVHFKPDRDWCVLWYSIFDALLNLKSCKKFKEELEALNLYSVSKVYQDELVKALDSNEYTFKKYGNINLI